MKVWVVMETDCFDNSTVVGVFSSLSLARQFEKTCEEPTTIYEMMIDNPPKG